MAREPITIEQLHRDLMDHARILTAHTQALEENKKILQEMEVDRRVKIERDKNLMERLDRMEENFEHSLGLFRKDMDERFNRFSKPLTIAATAVVTTSIALVVNFVFKGGFTLG